MEKIAKVFLFSFFLFFSFGGIVFAQDSDKYDLNSALDDLGLDATQRPQHLAGTGSELRGDASDITLFLQKITNGVAGVATAIAIIFLIQNSFSLLTAAGDSDGVSKAKKGIMWSLVGLVVIAGAYIIVKTAISLVYSGEAVSNPPVAEEIEE